MEGATWSMCFGERQTNCPRSHPSKSSSAFSLRPHSSQPVAEAAPASDQAWGHSGARHPCLTRVSLSGHSPATARNCPGAALLSVIFLPNFFLPPLLSHSPAHSVSSRSLPSVGIFLSKCLACLQLFDMLIISQLVDWEPRHGVIGSLPWDLSQGCHHGGQGGAFI